MSFTNELLQTAKSVKNAKYANKRQAALQEKLKSISFSSHIQVTTNPT